MATQASESKALMPRIRSEAESIIRDRRLHDESTEISKKKDAKDAVD